MDLHVTAFSCSYANVLQKRRSQQNKQLNVVPLLFQIAHTKHTFSNPTMSTAETSARMRMYKSRLSTLYLFDLVNI